MALVGNGRKCGAELENERDENGNDTPFFVLINQRRQIRLRRSLVPAYAVLKKLPALGYGMTLSFWCAAGAVTYDLFFSCIQ